MGLLLGGLFLGMLLGIGCSENVYANTDRADVCDTVRAWDGFTWWFLVLSPAALFVGSQLLPWFQRHALTAFVSVAIVLGGIWVYLLLVVSSNIGDTRAT